MQAAIVKEFERAKWLFILRSTVIASWQTPSMHYASAAIPVDCVWRRAAMAILLAVARLGRTARLKNPLLAHLSRSSILLALLVGGHEHGQNLSSHVALDALAGRKDLRVRYIALYKDSPYQAWTRSFASDTSKLVEAVVPFMGVSISDGTLSTFLKKPGDRVEVDEAIAQVETNKVTVDVNSPEAGFIEKFVALNEKGKERFP